MDSARKALEALAAAKTPDPPSERWIPKTWVETDGESWAAIGPVRTVVEPDDGDECGAAATLARRDAEYMCLAVNLAAPLAAVVRAAAERPWWTKSETVRGVQWVRCLGCGVDIPDTLDDVPHEQRHLPTSEGPCPFEESDAALDAFNAAAAEMGFQP